MSAQPVVDFVYFDAGGGHRSAALALQAVVATKGYPWQVRLVNLQEVLDPLDIFRKVFRIRLEDIYNKMLAKGWTLGSDMLLPLMHGVIRVYHGSQVKLLTKFWAEQKPHMVVALVPNFDRALYESLHAALPGTPFVTVLTDLADYPPHFWMERQPEQYFICGTPRAAGQARAIGHPPERIFQVSGMILRPTFYHEQTVDRKSERMRLGLDPELPTGLVLFGGEGSSVMKSIARSLGNADLPLQLIMICGRNERLKRELDALRTRNKIFVEGFTKQVPDYMHLADFFVGKPGPGSISEAIHMGLPVIVERNAWTLPQERYNAEWLRETGTGIVLRNFRHIESAVAELLQTDQLKTMQKRIAGMHNRAVFEVPELLNTILKQHKLVSESELTA